ncbi:MAG: polyhydroxyalkanoic acid system family protein [Myxococcaceae bacterium]
MYKKFWRALLPLIALAIASPVPAFAGEGDEVSSTSKISFLRRHSFSREEARVRLQQLFDYWSQAYGVQRRWYGDTARVTGRIMGIYFDARVTVKDGAVEAVASDPGFLFRGAAADYINSKLRKYMHPTYEER